MTEEMLPESYEYEPGDYVTGGRYYWKIEKRIWNHEADPDWYPIEHRQYILNRPRDDFQETLKLETITLSEKDLIHYELATQQEAEDHWAIK